MDVDLMKIAQEMRSKKMHNFYDRQHYSEGEVIYFSVTFLNALDY